MSAYSIADAPLELSMAIKEFFPEEEWDNAAGISALESGWRWDALNDTTDAQHPCGVPLAPVRGEKVTSEISIGYFQINWCNFQHWRQCSLWNARQNVGTAHALWIAAGWAPWLLSARALGLLP